MPQTVRQSLRLPLRAEDLEATPFVFYHCFSFFGQVNFKICSCNCAVVSQQSASKMLSKKENNVSLHCSWVHIDSSSVKLWSAIVSQPCEDLDGMGIHQFASCIMSLVNSLPQTKWFGMAWTSPCGHDKWWSWNDGALAAACLMMVPSTHLPSHLLRATNHSSVILEAKWLAVK